MKIKAWLSIVSDPVLRRAALRNLRGSVVDRKHSQAYRDRPATGDESRPLARSNKKGNASKQRLGGVAADRFEGIEGGTEQRADQTSPDDRDIAKKRTNGARNDRIRKKKAAVKSLRRSKDKRARFRPKRPLPLPIHKRTSLVAAARRRTRNPVHTDVGNAERFITLFGDDYKYCAEWEKWLSWDGHKWTLCANDAEPTVSAVATVRALLAEARAAADDAAISWATSCHDIGRIKSMIILASKDPRLAVHHDDLDCHHHIINVKNGMVNLHTGELMPHDRTFLCTKIANVEYDQNAICPRWIQFLETSMVDVDLINMLQRIAGYSMTGSVSEQCLFFFYGGGSNGKTTFLSTLQKILGDYAQPAPRGLLESDRNNDHDTRLAYLYRARLVVCSEVESGKHIAEALVKDLTGGERISARRMREDPWSFDPTAKIIVAGNHKPIVAGQDYGFWRRMKLIPWTVTIEESQKDPDLLAKLEAEYQGIFNWAVMGCVAWKTDGSGLRTNLIDHHVKEYKEEQLNEHRVKGSNYEDESSDFQEFFDNRLEPGKDFKVIKTKVYTEYQSWTIMNKRTKFSAVKLYDFLRRTKQISDKLENSQTPVREKNETGKLSEAFRGVRIKLRVAEWQDERDE